MQVTKLKFLFYLTFFILLNLKADELTSSKLDIKFFGTLGGVYNDTSDYIFRKGPFEKDGSSNDLDFLTDTVLGIQPTYNINDDFSLIAQGIANRDIFGDKKFTIDSAYLKYDSNENFILKIGRILAPYYKNSNNKNIGYSKLMIREPIEVYGQFPFSAYDGIEFIYSNIISKYFYTIQGNYGQAEFDVPMYSVEQILDNKIKEIKALNFTFGNDIVEARATYMEGQSTSDNQALTSLFKHLRLSGKNDLADKYELKDKRSQYFGLGLFLEYNDIIFATEYGKRRIEAFYANIHGYYATLGYRISSFTPYISHAKVIMDENNSSSSGSPYLDQLLKVQNVAQSSNTIGFKYHINQNLDFKFEFQRIKPKGEYGTFYLSESRDYSNSSSNVYSFVIDFVF